MRCDHWRAGAADRQLRLGMATDQLCWQIVAGAHLSLNGSSRLLVLNAQRGEAAHSADVLVVPAGTDSSPSKSGRQVLTISERRQPLREMPPTERPPCGVQC